MKRVGLWAVIGIGLSLSVGLLTVAPGYTKEKDHETECTPATLTGLYVFTATGYNIVPSGFATGPSTVPQPKAIVEVIDFNGDGTLTTPAVSRSANGVIFPNTVGSNGEYTVNEDCTGMISFLPNGPHLDIFIARNGKDINMIQTDANTVLAGVARRVSHDHADHDHK
jgi:hypothetical protein